MRKRLVFSSFPRSISHEGRLECVFYIATCRECKKGWKCHGAARGSATVFAVLTTSRPTIDVRLFRETRIKIEFMFAAVEMRRELSRRGAKEIEQEDQFPTLPYPRRFCFGLSLKISRAPLSLSFRVSQSYFVIFCSGCRASPSYDLGVRSPLSLYENP